MDVLTGLCLVVSPFVGVALARGATLWDEAPAPRTPWREWLPYWHWLSGAGRRAGSLEPVWRRPAAELGAVAIVLWAWSVSGAAAPALGVTPDVYVALSCLLGWLCLWAALVDVHVWRLPDPLTLALALSGLAATALVEPARLPGHLLGGAAGYGVLWAVANLYERLRGRAGLGLGDAKLLGALGCWLGWRALPFILTGAALTALLAIAALGVLQRRAPQRQDALPFGPFIALGAWLAWLYAFGRTL